MTTYVWILALDPFNAFHLGLFSSTSLYAGIPFVLCQNASIPFVLRQKVEVAFRFLLDWLVQNLFDVLA